jgi:asparagine synthase (glutamine-hydrolysing)
MCGIAGVAALSADPRLLDQARRMIAPLAHRGPDGQGEAAFPRCALGHRRLAVIDVECGAQPMRSPRGLTVVFNGEIYNFHELRRELAGGYPFSTHSDTEVLLAGYERWGKALFGRLRGMFALAFWDEAAQELILARDRFGKKPLFYEHRGDRLYFASELKALPREGPPDRVAALSYLALGYVPGERTMYQGVRRVGPGQVLSFANGALRCETFWGLPAPREQRGRSEEEWAARISALLDEAVTLRLIADVPLGAFLSGGLDSSTVVALCMKHRGRPFHTFSVRAAGGSPADADAARTVALALGTEHHELAYACPAPEEAQALMAHFDEPFADSSLFPTAAVARLARERVTVALSGDGADELFGGYYRYALARRGRRLCRVPGFSLLARALPRRLRGAEYLHKLAAAGSGYRGAVEIFSAGERRALLDATPAEEQESLAELDALFDGDGSVAAMQLADQRAYLPGDILPKVDLASMRHSLEVRSPFLDHVLAEELSGLPARLRMRGSLGKLLLRRIAKDLLPPAILTRPKMGFEVPLGDWLRGPLRELCADALDRPRNPLVDRARALGRAAPPRLPHEAQEQFTLLSLALWEAP